MTTPSHDNEFFDLLYELAENRLSAEQRRPARGTAQRGSGPAAGIRRFHVHRRRLAPHPGRGARGGEFGIWRFGDLEIWRFRRWCGSSTSEPTWRGTAAPTRTPNPEPRIPILSFPLPSPLAPLLSLCRQPGLLIHGRHVDRGRNAVGGLGLQNQSLSTDCRKSIAVGAAGRAAGVGRRRSDHGHDRLQMVRPEHSDLPERARSRWGDSSPWPQACWRLPTIPGRK